MNMKNSLLVLLLLISSYSNAGALLGTGTLNVADDLTIIGIGGGATLEFLDLTPTSGLTIAGALSTYSGNGFSWANGAQVSELYSAFGFSYSILANNFIDLGVTAGQAASFMSYLGTTRPDGALAFIDDLTGGGFYTYSCISVDLCSPNSFNRNSTFITPPWDGIGVFLVREGREGTVTEPATLGLLGVGLAGVGLMRRRRFKN